MNNCMATLFKCHSIIKQCSEKGEKRHYRKWSIESIFSAKIPVRKSLRIGKKGNGKYNYSRSPSLFYPTCFAESY